MPKVIDVSAPSLISSFSSQRVNRHSLLFLYSILIAFMSSSLILFYQSLTLLLSSEKAIFRNVIQRSKLIIVSTHLRHWMKTRIQQLEKHSSICILSSSQILFKRPLIFTEHLKQMLLHWHCTFKSGDNTPRNQFDLPSSRTGLITS